MSYTFSCNNSPLTGPIAVYLLVSTLVTAGWSKVKDSDGSTYSSSGAQVTSGAAGAGGLANNSAWFVLEAPAVSGQIRSLCFQRGTTNLIWRIKYSAAGRFTGGTPSATQVPSAADEIVMVGAGTDASPTGGTTFSADGSFRWHVVAGGAAEFYSFVAFGNTTGSATMLTAIAMDVMAAASFNAADPDPAVVYLQSTSLWSSDIGTQRAAQTAGASSTICFKAWLGSTATPGNFVQITIPSPFNLGSSAASPGVNPFDAKDDQMPMPYARIANQTAPFGWKGYSTLFLINSIQRTNMDTFSVSGTRNKVFVNSLVLPWDGSVPTI